MSDFRKLDEAVYASPQIGVAEIADAAALGVTLVVNNRPEGESDDQTPGAEIEAAAHAAGMDYIAIPVTMQTLSQDDVASMAQALGEAKGPVLAYCRSGTRSTLLWSLAEAKRGRDPEEVAAAAAAAGYDVSPVRAAMDALYAARG
ncbi:TIGR01244 family phosphatase [Altererythrobacter sp. CC-YST694]|uniref:TIGR01244 family sulfur transferase n=1 Tax=Altererythrobacter sp. CC-YST694 TaxID=2755038 RepID=UPI001D02B76C|nr:TIGR01244 family sulfur transferase [Altererythrobacter sp. CC-YST694]MCB5425246.1 TIGR01244 family phosphatase [Altererythrobacter sp. CC-YST694]